MRPQIAAALCMLALVSCGGGGEPSASATASATTGAAASVPATATAVASGEGPAVSITSPSDDASVKGSSVKVKVDVDHFKIVNKIGGKNVPGQGHLHFYLDVDEIPTEPAHEATVAGEGSYVATTETSYTWDPVTPGSHKLGVQLVQNNHTPLQPPVTAEITITVGG